jgi:Tol biopolymer transport system component
MEIDSSRAELRFAWPWFLPDGDRYLYLVRERDGWGNLMLAEPGKPPRPVGRIASFFQYVDPGYLVYAREGTLVAQRFDAKSGRVSGEPISVADRVRYFYSTAAAGFGARGRTIAYLSQSDESRLAWIDRSGRELGKLGSSGGYLDVRLSVDGKRLFFSRSRPGLETYHVWSYDIERGVETAITNALDTEAFPLPLGDGKTLVFSAVRGTPPLLMRRDLATGREEPMTEERRAFQVAMDLSPDGRTLLYKERSGPGNFDIWSIAVDGKARPVPVVQSPFNKDYARFSPDGHFVAFVSSDAGLPEAYVMAFPGPAEKVRVSNGGAELLRWSPSGELLYVSGEGDLISVPVRTSPALEIGKPSVLFRVTGKPWRDFDISRDGARFLAVVQEVDGNENPLNVVVNWAPGAAR